MFTRKWAPLELSAAPGFLVWSHAICCVAENGPFNIKEDLTLERNPYGWDKSHNMIFVDQPIGTGFSYSDSPDDTVYTEAGAHTPGIHTPDCDW